MPNGFAQSTLSLPYLPSYIYSEGDSTLKLFLLLKFTDVHIYFFFCKEHHNGSTGDCISPALQKSYNLKRSKAVVRWGFFFCICPISLFFLSSRELRMGGKRTLAFFPSLFFGAFPCCVVTTNKYHVYYLLWWPFSNNEFSTLSTELTLRTHFLGACQASSDNDCFLYDLEWILTFCLKSEKYHNALLLWFWLG